MSTKTKPKLMCHYEAGSPCCEIHDAADSLFALASKMTKGPFVPTQWVFEARAIVAAIEGRTDLPEPIEAREKETTK